MEATNLFGIQTVSSIDIELPNEKFGTIYVIGLRAELSEKLTEIKNSLLSGLDPRTSFYKYQFRILDVPKDSGSEWNLICPIEDPSTASKMYVVGDAPVSDLDLAISVIINESETQSRLYFEEAIVKAAIGSPEEFRSVIDKVILESLGDENRDSPYPNLGILPFGGVMSGLAGMALGLDGDFLDLDGTEAEADGVAYNEAAIGLAKDSHDQSKFHKLTAKDKKEALLKLPENATQNYIKENPELLKIIAETLSNMAAEEMRVTLLTLFEQNPEILRKYLTVTSGLDSQYEIFVRPWSRACRADFKDRFHYCIYIKDPTGNERPVVFKNYPSYCIFTIYLLDRVQRKDEVCGLNIRSMKDVFCKVYSKIISETDSNIRNHFEKLGYRNVGNTGLRRKGRYDDYIKDINDTMSELLGVSNCIPFKVGNNRFIEINPEKIHIDPQLAEVKVC